jgi:hypothetical protein
MSSTYASMVRPMWHTSLIRSARVSEAKWHRHVAEHAERCDEGSCELIGLLHLYLVVPGIGIKET